MLLNEYKVWFMTFDDVGFMLQVFPATEAGTLSSALSVLTAMITPAVLISACGTLILSTSTRLGRVVDRVRALADRAEQLARTEEVVELAEERRAALYDQLDKLTSRARLLQRCMTIFYLALGIFVMTSVLIGVVAVSGLYYSFIPVTTGLIGACFLFYGSILLVFEARLAFATIRTEMDFVWRLSKHFTPEELIAERHRPLNLVFKRRKSDKLRGD